MELSYSFLTGLAAAPFSQAGTDPALGVVVGWVFVTSDIRRSQGASSCVPDAGTRAYIWWPLS